MSAHTCHAAGCATAVPPKMFMCKRHWYTLPKKLRDSIWSEYTPRQEITKSPSLSYLLTAAWCICYVADKEGIADHEHVRSAEAIANNE